MGLKFPEITEIVIGAVKSSRLQAKIATYLVSIGQLLCLAFLYEWRFLKFYKISLDWPLTLTTQPSTSKLSDNPGYGLSSDNDKPIC